MNRYSEEGARQDLDLSVIVPTFNRLESLRRLLHSLDARECPDSIRFEVVIVDNGSEDGTQDMLRGHGARLQRFSLEVLEERDRGKAKALNRGLARARGRIVLIVDDDVVVHPECLLKHLECYRTTDFDALQGRILPGVDAEGKPADPKRLRQYNIPVVDYGDEVREIRGLTGTNMSLKREVLERVGFFDARLGPGAAGFSEDTEYSMRIRKAGFKIGYTPHAVVYHELNPVRYGSGYNRAVQYRKGLSRSLYRRDSIVFNVLPNLFANCVRFGFYRLLGKEQKAYKTEGRILKYWGYLMGKFHRFQN